MKGSVVVTSVAFELRNYLLSATIEPGYVLVVEVVGNPNSISFGTTNSSTTAPYYFNLSCNSNISPLSDPDVVLNVNGDFDDAPTKITGLASGSEFPVGTTTNSFRYSDGTTCSFTVTVNDTQDPVLTAPDPVEECLSSTGTYSVPALQTRDNCGIDGTYYNITGATTCSGSGLNASGAFNPGTSTIEWTVTDEHGNSQTAETTITVTNALTASIPIRVGKNRSRSKAGAGIPP